MHWKAAKLSRKLGGGQRQKGLGGRWPEARTPGNPQNSLRGQHGQRGKGDSENLIKSDSPYYQHSHISLENEVDHLDYLDQARDSAGFSGRCQKNDVDQTGFDVDQTEIARAVGLYAGWWPLRLMTLCRAVVAARYPLAVTPLHEFLKRLDEITPEFQGRVRWAARQAIKAGKIPSRSVDLRGEPSDEPPF